MRVVCGIASRVCAVRLQKLGENMVETRSLQLDTFILGAMSLPGPVSEWSWIVCMAKRLTITHVPRDLGLCQDQTRFRHPMDF